MSEFETRQLRLAAPLLGDKGPIDVRLWLDGRVALDFPDRGWLRANNGGGGTTSLWATGDPNHEVEFLPVDASGHVVKFTPGAIVRLRSVSKPDEHLQLVQNGRLMANAWPHEATEFVVLTAEGGLSIAPAAASPAPRRAATPLHLEPIGQDDTGAQLKNAEGRDEFLKGVTAFPAFESWLDGDGRLEPFLADCEQWGVNCLRVFLQFHYLAVNEFPGKRPFNPSHYGDRFYVELPKFLAHVRDRGFYVFQSVFPDTGLLHQDQSWRLTHWEQIVVISRAIGNVLLELTNEPTAHDFNSVDPHAFPRPSGLLATPGDAGGVAYSAGKLGSPVWDFGTIHVDRSVKAGVLDNCAYDNPYFKAGHGILSGEPVRYGPNGSPPNYPPSHAYHAACAARAGMMGWFLHTQNGKRLEPFDAETRPFAEAVFRRAYGAL
jgi:hypothetical protein